MSSLTRLDQLYVSDNGLTDISGLDNNTAMETLDVANNRITQLGGLATLTQLQEFWANNNKVRYKHSYKSITTVIRGNGRPN